jgi:Tfp pilus assembly protein PilO
MTAKKFFYIMIGFILLSVVGLGGSFVWGDKLLKTKAISISDLLADKDVQQDKKIALEKAKNSAGDQEKIKELLSTLVPEKKEQESLIVDIIYTATDKAGILPSQINNFAFSGGAQPDDLSGTEKSKDISGVYTYPFTLQLQDVGYTTLLTFLSLIETNDRIVQVSDIQITPNKTSAGSLSSVSLSMKAYIKP